MANANSTLSIQPALQDNPVQLGHGVFGRSLLQIRPGADKADIADLLIVRLTHLHAMLEGTYGIGKEWFDDMASLQREGYMWGCAYLAEECKELAMCLEGVGGKGMLAEMMGASNV